MKKTIDSVRGALSMKDRKKKQPRRGGMTSDGAEIPDPQPLFLEIGEKRPPRLSQSIQDVIKQQKIAMERAGEIDPDEENDFEIPDDDLGEFTTPYEFEDRIRSMVEEAPEGERQRLADFAREIASELRKTAPEARPETVDPSPPDDVGSAGPTQ